MYRNAKAWARAGLYTLVLACAGCQQNDMRQARAVHSPGNSPQATTGNALHTMPAEISIEEQIQGAKLDLASRLGIGLDAITVKEARSVQWGSGALGCPKPGMSYTQAIIPGVLVKLDTGGTLYRYHGRMNSKLFFCPADRAREPAYGPGQEIM